MYISCTNQRENVKRDVCKGMNELFNMYTSRVAKTEVIYERFKSYLNRNVDPSNNNYPREFDESTSTDKRDMSDIMTTPDGDGNPIPEVVYDCPLTSTHMYSITLGQNPSKTGHLIRK